MRGARHRVDCCPMRCAALREARVLSSDVVFGVWRFVEWVLTSPQPAHPYSAGRVPCRPWRCGCQAPTQAGFVKPCRVLCLECLSPENPMHDFPCASPWPCSSRTRGWRPGGPGRAGFGAWARDAELKILGERGTRVSYPNQWYGNAGCARCRSLVRPHSSSSSPRPGQGVSPGLARCRAPDDTRRLRARRAGSRQQAEDSGQRAAGRRAGAGAGVCCMPVIGGYASAWERWERCRALPAAFRARRCRVVAPHAPVVARGRP